MSIRDQILNASDDFKSEVVDVPEWGVKLVMRELNVNDRGRLTLSDFEQVEVAGGWALKPKYDPIAAARVVVLSAYDEDGTRVFTDEDATALGARAFTVVDRLADVTRRLSGLGTDPRLVLSQVRDLIDSGADLETIRNVADEALDGETLGKERGNASSPTQSGETSTS